MSERCVQHWCIYCSASSFACTSHSKSCRVDVLSAMMTCASCNSMLCKDCITEIINFIDQCPFIPSQVKADDLSFKLLKNIQTNFDLGSYDTIATRPCCLFITPNEHNSLSMNYWYCPLGYLTRALWQSHLLCHHQCQFHHRYCQENIGH